MSNQINITLSEAINTLIQTQLEEIFTKPFPAQSDTNKTMVDMIDDLLRPGTYMNWMRQHKTNVNVLYGSLSPTHTINGQHVNFAKFTFMLWFTFHSPNIENDNVQFAPANSPLSNMNTPLSDAADQAHDRYLGTDNVVLYNERVEEASDYVAANYPKSLKSYPLIKAETDALGKSAKKTADDIISHKSKWVTAAAKIEKIHLETNVNIEKAIKDLDKV